MKKRVHKKNHNAKLNKRELNVVYNKLDTNPRRFDFKEKKYREWLADKIAKLKEKLMGGKKNEQAAA